MLAEGATACQLPDAVSLWALMSPRFTPHRTACLLAPWRLGPTQQSCSSSPRLFVTVHMLQAASHLGDFVPVSPLPGSHALPPAPG